VKKMLFLFVAALVLLPVMAMAEQEMNQDEACKILGNCADDSIKAAETMRTHCANMMELANAQMAKGMQIKTRGQMWSDKDMVAEGDSLIERGKVMLEQAKKMDEQCKLIIDQAQKSKKKASEMNKNYEDKSKGKKDEPKL
jgi:hypothetical protein